MENLGNHELRNAQRTMPPDEGSQHRLPCCRPAAPLGGAAPSPPVASLSSAHRRYGPPPFDGNLGRVRVIARALYKTGQPERLLQVVEAQRYRQPHARLAPFTATAMSDAPVTIVIDGTKYEAYHRPRRRVDVKLQHRPEPGMHTKSSCVLGLAP